MKSRWGSGVDASASLTIKPSAQKTKNNSVNAQLLIAIDDLEKRIFALEKKQEESGGGFAAAEPLSHKDVALARSFLYGHLGELAKLLAPELISFIRGETC